MSLGIQPPDISLLDQQPPFYTKPSSSTSTNHSTNSFLSHSHSHSHSHPHSTTGATATSPSSSTTTIASSHLSFAAADNKMIHNQRPRTTTDNDLSTFDFTALSAQLPPNTGPAGTVPVTNGNGNGASSNKNLSHVPCKFFKQGICQAGNSCPFSHNLDGSLAADKLPCKYFQKGNCRFGLKCALAHFMPDGSKVNSRSLLVSSGYSSNGNSNSNHSNGNGSAGNGHRLSFNYSSTSSNNNNNNNINGSGNNSNGSSLYQSSATTTASSATSAITPPSSSEPIDIGGLKHSSTSSSINISPTYHTYGQPLSQTNATATNNTTTNNNNVANFINIGSYGTTSQSMNPYGQSQLQSQSTYQHQSQSHSLQQQPQQAHHHHFQSQSYQQQPYPPQQQQQQQQFIPHSNSFGSHDATYSTANNNYNVNGNSHNTGLSFINTNTQYGQSSHGVGNNSNVFRSHPANTPISLSTISPSQNSSFFSTAGGSGTGSGASSNTSFGQSPQYASFGKTSFSSRIQSSTQPQSLTQNSSPTYYYHNTSNHDNSAILDDEEFNTPTSKVNGEIFAEDYVPASLSDIILTPQELQRRDSRSQSGTLLVRPSLNSILSSNSITSNPVTPPNNGAHIQHLPQQVQHKDDAESAILLQNPHSHAYSNDAFRRDSGSKTSSNHDDVFLMD